MSELAIALSSLDESRFGVRAARAFDVTAEQIDDLLTFCEREQVQFLIMRTDTRHLPVVHRLTQEGFMLMDTLVKYRRDLTRYPLSDEEPPATMRPAIPDDAPAIDTIARESFQGYYGHYHADPRLDNETCDAVYIDWARRSLNNADVAQAVYVADDAGTVVGFITAKIRPNGDGELILSGVSPQARQRGIYGALLDAGAAWCQEQGADGVWVVTQIVNTSVQKALVGRGFRLQHSTYTIHKWFD